MVDITTAAGAQSIITQFIPGKEYFIEVVSGHNAGHRWEINEFSSSASNLVVDLGNPWNTQTTLPINLAGDQIVVREHVTFAETFAPAKFHASNSPSTADRILFSSPGSASFTIYWLYNNSGNPKWVDAAFANFNDVGVKPLNNCQGVFIHPKASPVNLVLSGQVRQNVAACPVKIGPNMVSGAWPITQAASGIQLTIANGFTGNANPRLADKVLFWAGDDTAGKEAYLSHFEVSAGSHHHLTPMANASLANEDAVPLFRALHANFIQSISGKANWVMPLPWTP